MAEKSQIPRLGHLVEAIGNIRMVTAEDDFAAFEKDWRTRWAVERAFEIVSEASRHLSDDLKGRHPDIPWQRIAAIGNRLRHEYQEILPDILWKIARDDMSRLEHVCREELAAAQARERDSGRRDR